MSQFGTEFCDSFATVRFEDGAWQPPTIQPLAPLALHPASHVFHYASTCFEGFKAYRWKDGRARVFRLDDHVARMRKSAESLRLPIPEANTLSDMVVDLIAQHVEDIPEPPSSLYIRPTLVGTTPNIGAAAAPASDALLFVLLSPVGNYFSGGVQPLKLLVDDVLARSTAQLGSTKTGGNYAAAPGPTLDAQREFGVHQVLFCPDGDVQETGAANFILLTDDEVITKPLDDSFLHGMTRTSILTLAEDLGYRINEQNFTVTELLEWAETHEAALSGTAAGLTPVGTFVYQGREITVRDGQGGANTSKLRHALQDVHYGQAPDPHGWLTVV